MNKKLSALSLALIMTVSGNVFATPAGGAPAPAGTSVGSSTGRASEKGLHDDATSGRGDATSGRGKVSNVDTPVNTPSTATAPAPAGSGAAVGGAAGGWGTMGTLGVVAAVAAVGVAVSGNNNTVVSVTP